MSEQEPDPSQNPYGQPSSPYGQPSAPSPYGNPPSGNSPQSPYGSTPPGQSPYGSVITPMGGSGGRPGTVTAAAWITIVLSGMTAVFFAFFALMFVVARDSAITEMEKSPDFQDLEIEPSSIVGVLVAILLAFCLWAVISVVLAIFVLRRSNAARILLTISAAVVAVISLVGIASLVSAIWLIATVAVIVLLYVGGAGAWFSQSPSDLGVGGYPGSPPAAGPTTPYGQQSDNLTTSEDGTYYPPQDYPGR